MNIDTLLDQLEADSAGMSKEASAVTVEKTDAGTELEKTLTKEASAEEKGRQAAIGLLNKIAQVSQETPTKEEEDMSKQAESLADKIAEKLMEKFADVPNEGDANPFSNVVPGVAVENKINQDNRAMLEQHNQRVKPTPGTDGTYNGGNVNQILDAIVDDALAIGGGTYDQVAANKANSAVTTSKDEATDPAIRDNHGGQFKPSGVIKEAEDYMDDEIEKLAAVEALVEAGIDFDTSVELVKQAAEEIESEEFDLLKAAALDDLLVEGYDFSDAVDMVKDAAAGHTVAKSLKAAATGKGGGMGRFAKGTTREEARILTKGTHREELKAHAKRKADAAVQGVKDNASRAAHDAKVIATGKEKGTGRVPSSLRRGMAWQSLKGNPFAQGVAGVGAVGVGGAGYAAHKHNEKRAAFIELVNNGIDFETAADLVIEKSAELYGDDE